MTPDWWSKVEPEAHDTLERFTEKLRAKLSAPPERIVGRKNPFLFRARIERDAHEFARMVTDAYLSSSEETMFGNVLEDIAVSICTHARGGWKSSAAKIDLEYVRDSTRCILQIKSGVNWGNSSQKQAMINSFQQATRILQQGNQTLHVQAIEGICYGKSQVNVLPTHHRYIGHSFWEEISGWGGTAAAVMGLIGTHASNGLNEARASACQRIVSYLEDNGAAASVQLESHHPHQAVPRCNMEWGKLLDLVLAKP